MSDTEDRYPFPASLWKRLEDLAGEMREAGEGSDSNAPQGLAARWGIRLHAVLGEACACHRAQEEYTRGDDRFPYSRISFAPLAKAPATLYDTPGLSEAVERLRGKPGATTHTEEGHMVGNAGPVKLVHSASGSAEGVMGFWEGKLGRAYIHDQVAVTSAKLDRSIEKTIRLCRDQTGRVPQYMWMRPDGDEIVGSGDLMPKGGPWVVLTITPEVVELVLNRPEEIKVVTVAASPELIKAVKGASRTGTVGFSRGNLMSRKDASEYDVEPWYALDDDGDPVVIPGLANEQLVQERQAVTPCSLGLTKDAPPQVWCFPCAERDGVDLSYDDTEADLTDDACCSCGYRLG